MTAYNLRGVMKLTLLFVGTVLLISDYAESAKQTSRAEQIAIAQDIERAADVLVPMEGTEPDADSATRAARRRAVARQRRQYSYQAAYAANQAAESSNSQSSSFYAGGRRRKGKKRSVFDAPFYPSAYLDYDEGPEEDDPYGYEFRKKKKKKRAAKRKKY